MWEKSIFCGKAVKTFPQNGIKIKSRRFFRADGG